MSSPPSSVRNAPAAEIATKMRCGSCGSKTIVCRHMPPAPGCHAGPVPCRRNPLSSCQFCAAVGRAKERGVFDPGVTVSGSVSDGRGARRARTPTGAACRRTTDACRGRRRRQRCSRPVAHVVPPSSERCISCPNQPRGLRGVEPVRIDRRALDVIDFPAGEERTADVPAFTLFIRCKNERALARAHQHTYTAHRSMFSGGIARTPLGTSPRWPSCHEGANCYA